MQIQMVDLRPQIVSIDCLSNTIGGTDSVKFNCSPYQMVKLNGQTELLGLNRTDSQMIKDAASKQPFNDLFNNLNVSYQSKILTFDRRKSSPMTKSHHFRWFLLTRTTLRNFTATFQDSQCESHCVINGINLAKRLSDNRIKNLKRDLIQNQILFFFSLA